MRAFLRAQFLFLVCLILSACGGTGRRPRPLGAESTGNYALEPPPFNGILKVVSYNIAFSEEVNQAAEDLNELEELRDADILLLQEMDETGTAEIAQALQYNYVYFSAGIHPRHGRCFGNAILSRWPLQDPQRVVLPHTNPRNGQQRIAALAVVSIDDMKLLVYSVHTETVWLGASKRADQISSLIDSIDEAYAHVVVGGDFNTLTPGAVGRLEGQFEEAGFERATRGTGPTVEPRTLGLTLDHIFVRGMTVLDRDSAQGASASDHLPIWADLSPSRRSHTLYRETTPALVLAN